MKKLFCMFLSLSVVFAIAACGASDIKDASAPDAAPTPSASASDAQISAEPSDDATAKPTESSTKSLVVYFSRSGNTRNVAQSIQNQTGSDIFEIVPKTPYDADYDALLDIAKTEQQQSVRPEIANQIENLDDYDTIYVGYPIWWGDMPMILYTFFDTYDLSGKTVALFCTSGGSGLSNTVNEVKTLEPGAIVTEGLHIGSSAASDTDSTVKSWLDKIG